MRPLAHEYAMVEGKSIGMENYELARSVVGGSDDGLRKCGYGANDWGAG
jgi:hypothetical protein